MPRYPLVVNGATQTVEAWDGDMPLLYVLRNALGRVPPADLHELI